MTTIRQAVGPARYEQMRRSLKATFPDDEAVVSDLAVDVAFQVAKYDWGAPDLSNLAIPALAVHAARANDPTLTYYEGVATHVRTAAPGSVFTGHLPLVRFRLPDRGTSQSLPTIHTPAGDLLPVDRLSPSVDVLWETYRSDPLLKFGRPERVEMITPPRLDGARFAAISLYLCYAKQTDASPSFYVLEAGLATGQARMPFLGRTMDAEIVAQTQYKPTSFSERFHFYRGRLTMRSDAPGEPGTLSVKVYEKGGKPLERQYLDVTVEYRQRATPLLTNPFCLTVEAGARIQAIADALGVSSNLDEAWLLRLVDVVKLNSLFTVVPKKSQPKVPA